MHRALWVLSFQEQLESITIQDLRAPASSDASSSGGEPLASLGEAVVFRGRDAACGLPPACHTTTNPHIALSLASMPQVRFHDCSVMIKGRRGCHTCVQAQGLTERAPFMPAWYRRVRAS